MFTFHHLCSAYIIATAGVGETRIPRFSATLEGKAACRVLDEVCDDHRVFPGERSLVARAHLQVSQKSKP